jgi:hypothetical protein
MLGQRNGVVHGGSLMRVAFFSVLLAVIGTGVLAHAEPRRVGIPGLSAEFAPVWAANDRGFLKKYGFESEIIAMQGGTQGAGSYRRKYSDCGDGRSVSKRGGSLSRSGDDCHPHGQAALYVDRKA